jgi:ubiquinone/menaquinone biosynthesis C-methylase UbiE
MIMNKYVHGYSDQEMGRLRDQSLIIEELLHGDTSYPAGASVLEAGCGVGAQTAILTRRNPKAEFTSIDLSGKSIMEARKLVSNLNITKVRLLQANINNLPFADSSFDHVFICFVLEHLENPLTALIEIRRILKTGGTVTVIEGDHDSFIWQPETSESKKVWESLIKVQSGLGQDPLIGRKLYPLLTSAGFDILKVSPKSIYADGNYSQLKRLGLTKILIPMIESVKEQAIDLKLVDPQTWNNGIGCFRQASESEDSTYFYTWFKALAMKK